MHKLDGNRSVITSILRGSHRIVHNINTNLLYTSSRSYQILGTWLQNITYFYFLLILFFPKTIWRLHFFLRWWKFSCMTLHIDEDYFNIGPLSFHLLTILTATVWIYFWMIYNYIIDRYNWTAQPTNDMLNM